MEEIKNLLDLNTEVKVQKDVIVLLTQNDCAKCEIIKNVLPGFQDAGDITKPVLVLNLDGEGVDREKAVKYFDIMSTPVLLGYKGGELKEKFEGNVTPLQLTKLESL